MQTNRIDVELSENLIDGQRGITKDSLANLFKSENVYKSKEDTLNVSKSLQSLQMDFGGTDNLITSLRSDASRGIDGTQADLQRRRDEHGTNTRHVREVQSLGELIMDVFEDFILKVLMVAAVVAMVVGIYNDGFAIGWIDGVSILVAIVIIVVVTVTNNMAKEAKFQELMQRSDVMSARVRRNDTYKTVDSQELVVGDVIQLEQGDTVPADCIIVECEELGCNESALTGEPEAMLKEALNQENFKHNPCPFLLQGSLVENGSGKAVVMAVGDNTNQGRAGLSMNIEGENTPLQNKLDTIANQIGKLGFAVAILVFIVVCIRTMLRIFWEQERSLTDNQNIADVLNAFILGITIVVVAIPEGLPLAVTIGLAFSVGNLQKENNLVRSMKSAETMGNANEICTDKTGTLTLNQMQVMEVYLEDEIVQGATHPSILSTASCQIVAESIIYNSTAYIETSDVGVKETSGNVTEVGLIKYLSQSKVQAEKMIEQRDKNEIIFKLPFNSKRKRATTVIKHPSQAGRVRVFVKGAPEIVIEKCISFIGQRGEVMNMTPEKRDRIIYEDVVKKFARKCYRTLLIAYADYDEAKWEEMKAEHNNFQSIEDKEAAEQGLVLVGIMGLQDPLRPGIAEAVTSCHLAGINVRMVTGDNIETATAIAKKANILTDADLADNEDQHVCMTGESFRNAINGTVEQKPRSEEDKVGVVCHIGNMRKFREIERKLKVLARSQPDDKFMLVHGLIELGRVVAVTGDGTNDAPALHRSDVGFAMGKTGTDVAKNAADIQLLDDNFCSILSAVKYGRSTFDNIRKFLQFQMTVNVCALFIVFSGSLVFDDAPLTSVQMLWVNLIMDTLAALALATEPPSAGIVEGRHPESRDAMIINGTMWRNILGHAIMQIGVLLGLLFQGRNLFGIQYRDDDPFYPNAEWIAAHPGTTYQAGLPTPKVEMYTIIFNAFIMMQLFNMINARKLGEREFNIFKGFFNNWLFIAVYTLMWVVQICTVQFGGRPFRTVPLDINRNLICLGIGSFSFFWGIIIKFLPGSWFDWIKMPEHEMDDKEEEDSITANLRKSFRQSRANRNSQRGSHHDSSRGGNK